MTHQTLLYRNLTAGENLEFWGELYGVRNPRAQAARMLEKIGLGRAAERPVRSLSRGTEQRLALARAMVATPRLMLLDEPFTALDPEGTVIVGEMLREAVRAGAALVLTAHVPIEIEGLECDLQSLEDGRLVPFREEKGAGRLRSLFNR